MSVLARSVAEPFFEPDAHDPFEWLDLAACQGVPIEVFFPPTGTWFTQAREICSSCSVIEWCRQSNDKAEQDEPDSALAGFYAGESPRERAARRCGQLVASSAD